LRTCKSWGRESCLCLNKDNGLANILVAHRCWAAYTTLKIAKYIAILQYDASFLSLQNESFFQMATLFWKLCCLKR
jgi:hypothetical protein